MNRSLQSTRPSGSLGHAATGPDAPAAAGSPRSVVVDGDVALARNTGECESLSVHHGLDPECGIVSGLHVRGDLFLGHTPTSRADEACAYLAVAGGARLFAPPALLVDRSIQSPPRAEMLFVLRGGVSASMFVLWSGHLLGDGWLRLRDRHGTKDATDATDAIGAFMGPNLTLEPFGCEAVAGTGNHRLSRDPEYAALDFDMGVVMQRSTLRLRFGPRDWEDRTSDRLIVRGPLHLGGATLEVNSAFPSLPVELRAGDEFVLVEAGSIRGEFSKVSVPRLPKGLRGRLERSATRLVLHIIEPSSA